ncbi:VOC family protein [Paenibacillus oleatilyticus]|uniref:VOC family protein n=1 Tax=Paenibacillus oleatilyticus TaxID=2594886 RepID=A0ABV4UX43_9BACL
MSELFSRVDTVFLIAGEFDRSIEWYGEKLGLTPGYRSRGAATFHAGSGTPLTLIDAAVLEEEHPIFNFYTPDIDVAHKHLTERGADPGPIRHYGDMATFDFRDVDGRLLNVCHY